MMKKRKQKSQTKARLKAEISAHVAKAFPGCTAQFVGKPGKVSPRVRLLGFRVVEEDTGQARSNLTWVDPEYTGPITEAWVRDAVVASNG